MQEKSDPLNSRSYLPPSSSLHGVLPSSSSFHGVPWHVYPAVPAVPTVPCRHPAQLFLSGLGEITFYRSNNARRTKSLVLLLENDVEVFRPTKMLQPWVLSQRPKQPPPHKATRTALSETGSRVADLNIHQSQTPEFALISFL